MPEQSRPAPVILRPPVRDKSTHLPGTTHLLRCIPHCGAHENYILHMCDYPAGGKGGIILSSLLGRLKAKHLVILQPDNSWLSKINQLAVAHDQRHSDASRSTERPWKGQHASSRLASKTKTGQVLIVHSEHVEQRQEESSTGSHGRSTASGSSGSV